MRIATWNINSVRLRVDLLAEVCRLLKPDVICLQETKTEDRFFPLEFVNNLGYPYAVFSGEKSYNGVAIISKFKIDDSFSIDLFNDHKRHICALIHGIEIHNFYIPAGGDEPDIEINPKFKHKLEYIRLMQEWFEVNRKQEDKIILAGDFNIAPHEHDVWSSSQLKRVVSHTPVERKALLNLQNSFNFIDTGRHFIPLEQKLYTWWSYRNKDWKKSNRGRRLDHIWASKSLESSLKSVVHLPESREWERPSDHVPVLLEMQFKNN